jgi:hypothetical protein
VVVFVFHVEIASRVVVVMVMVKVMGDVVIVHW